jgi:hypothetical protein
MANTMATVQDWGKRLLIRPITRAVKTVNGQAAHEEIKGYIVENEAVNTALVTRVLRIESRVRLLTVLGVILAVAELIHWIVR